MAEAGLRAIVVPRQPPIRSYRLLPNGDARLTLGPDNQADGIALRGKLSVTVIKDVIPAGILPFDLLGLGVVPIEERAGLGGFAALRGGQESTCLRPCLEGLSGRALRRLGHTSSP